MKFNCSWALHAPYGPEYSTAPAIRRDDETTTLRVSTCGYDATKAPTASKAQRFRVFTRIRFKAQTMGCQLKFGYFTVRELSFDTQQPTAYRR